MTEVKKRICLTGIGWLIASGVFALPIDDRFDVSRVIDKAAAEQILDEPVKVPTPRNMHGSDGYYSKCNYYSARSKKVLIIRVYQAGPGFDPQKELDAVKASSGLAKPVSGLGDRAEAYSGAEGSLPDNGVMLYVIKGNTLITVGISGLDNANDALDKSKGVAEKILAQL